ncbi:hypothetical protein CsatA_007581 [Cannabis sativa]
MCQEIKMKMGCETDLVSWSVKEIVVESQTREFRESSERELENDNELLVPLALKLMKWQRPREEKWVKRADDS